MDAALGILLRGPLDSRLPGISSSLLLPLQLCNWGSEVMTTARNSQMPFQVHT